MLVSQTIFGAHRQPTRMTGRTFERPNFPGPESGFENPVSAFSLQSFPSVGEAITTTYRLKLHVDVSSG